MLVNIPKRFCFLSMPKCASTSIESAISEKCDIVLTGNPSIKHMGVSAFYKKVRPIVNNATNDKIDSVILFREPIEWLDSWYRYRARDELKNPRSSNHKNYTGKISFNEFVESYINGQDQPFSRVGRQMNMIQMPDGSIGVDHIFRYEDINSLIRFLEKRLGERLNIPKMNVSKAKKDLNLNPELMERLVEYLSPEYEVYNSIS